MKIAILSRDRTIYSCRRLSEAAKKQNHHVEIIDPLSCYIKINNALPTIYSRNEILPHFDAVIPRISTYINFYGTTILQQFENCGSYALNKSRAIKRTRDKFYTMQLLTKAGIDIPVTGISYYLKNTHHLIEMVGGPPLIIKLLEGTQGIGVILAETIAVAESIIDTFRSLNIKFMVQEFIKESKGKDLRCLVIGNEVVAAIERKAKTGDFRSNLHRGGKAYPVEITSLERDMAIQSAFTLGLNVAGVDILRANRGSLIMEVNASPGLEGIETVTGLDIASMMINWINCHYNADMY
ncbi:30S ribosomal protein S6--L-glutamate ligase [Candidatus Ishikawella capsulata]|nr:30S ribosomal protein S6--L-glutamate ligase [Candidatus Ishikawaella capsulata]